MSDSAQHTDGAAAPEDASRHLATIIERPWRAVYEFASDPRNLPRWAGGLAGSEVQREVTQWSMNSPMGRVLVSFVPENELGVMDHSVTLPTGESTLNPLRVLPLEESRCEVVFTLRRGTMSESEFAEDAAAVAEDLATLKEICERD
ncbi:MAG: SRPBCC family protein [Brachybacterium sp.]|uniref:SRPBCC family protein n=1 Tax=Brachybacterium sp. TaxID=1891286 RepID=UPI003F91F71F